jgi:hypothetical protein
MKAKRGAPDGEKQPRTADAVLEVPRDYLDAVQYSLINFEIVAR